MTRVIKTDTWKAETTSSAISGLGQILFNQPWRQNTGCDVRKPDQDIWFSDDPYDKLVAATTCETACPVKDLCYQQAVESGETHGIRGGWDFDPKHKNKTPARCKNGHLIAEDVYIWRDGRDIQCGPCYREQHRRDLDAQIERNERKNAQRRARRSIKLAMLDGAA